MKKVPKEYHLEIEIFIEQDTDIFSNSRSEDHKIELLKGMQTLFMQNYKLLLKQKMDAIKKNINKHLRKSFIRPSSSAVAASVLLVRKVSGKLRFCIDYKALNKITVKN